MAQINCVIWKSISVKTHKLNNFVIIDENKLLDLIKNFKLDNCWFIKKNI